MKTWTSVMTLLCALSLALPALAAQRPEHFEGKPADTIEQAVANFREYNTRLAHILSKDELTPQDLREVHELTYTLENAVEKLRAEMAELAEVLEEVHLASETTDAETVRSRGEEFLDTARRIVR